jgi:hypothetical protein
LPSPGFGTPGGTFTNATAIALNSPLNTSQSFVLSFPDGTSQTNTVTGTTTSITINQTGDYHLQLFKSPWLPSLIVTNAYTFQCADLSVTPASMNFSFPMAVQAASGSNPKPMTIFYTSDGTLPTTNSALYTGAISVSNTITLRFLGTRLGYLPQYVDRQYNYAPGCTISPPTSTNSQAITVTITPVNGNSAIYFRLNGGAWTNYANPFTLDGYAGGSGVDGGLHRDGAVRQRHQPDDLHLPGCPAFGQPADRRPNGRPQRHGRHGHPGGLLVLWLQLLRRHPGRFQSYQSLHRASGSHQHRGFAL